MRSGNDSYRLLVVDVDGTLLDKRGAVSDENGEALARASAQGVRVTLSTGRVAQACRKILSQLSLSGYHIFSDGALVCDPATGEEVYVEPISHEVVREIAGYLHSTGIGMDLFSTTHYFVERENWATDIRRDFFGLPPTIVDFTRLWERERIIKGTLVIASDEEKVKANDFCRHFKDRLDFSWTKTPAYPDIDFINVLAPAVSKGAALEALASFLDIPLSNVMAIGDGANDISLLARAGLSVAVDNASDEVKAVADYVTLDVDHNGVAAAIDKFLMRK